MRAAAAGSVSGSGSQLSSVLGSAGGDGAPEAAALAWTVAAVTRRELGAVGATAKAAAVTTTGQRTPLADFVRTFIGNGTADHPDAGILVGNGFSYDSTTCTGDTACNGGKGGILGDGGAGYNGGNGGNAGWFGTGGDGGDGLAGQSGGDGGRGGLFFGSGGYGGTGGDATTLAGGGGNGGTGGATGALSVLGFGGNGGNGGQGASGFASGGNGGSGGQGGDGGWLLSRGGDGGDGGDGGSSAGNDPHGQGGAGGAAGKGRLLVLFSNNGTPGTDGLPGGCNAACGSSALNVFAPYIDMAAMGQREQTWYMNDSVDPAQTGKPSLVATMTKTEIQAATLAFVNQTAAGGDFIWGSASNSLYKFNDPSGIAIKEDIAAALANRLTAIVSFGGITACQNGVEIGQLNGKAGGTQSGRVPATGQTVVTLPLETPINLATIEQGSIAGQFLIYGGPTDLYTVDKNGTFTFTHVARYPVPKATSGALVTEGNNVTAIAITLDRALGSENVDASTIVSYGLPEGFVAMKKAYEDAITYFYDMGIRHFDLDIEGPALSLSQWGINNQRNRVFKAIQDENVFPGMDLSYVLPIGPNSGWAPTTDPGRLITSAGQVGLKVETWNMMAFDYGVEVYEYMLANQKNMVDMLIAEADTGINIKDFPIKGAVDYLVDYGLATSREDAFHKLGVTLMVGQDDTLYVEGATPEHYVPGDAATVEAITPAQVGGAGNTVMNWAHANGVGLLSMWSLGRDRPSYNTTNYNPTMSVAFQTGSPAVTNVKTSIVPGGGATSVDLPFAPSDRGLQSGDVYDGSSAWLGSYWINSSNQLVMSPSQSAPVKPTGGTVDPTTGLLRVTFDGSVTSGIWSRIDYVPLILENYQDQDLVYTELLNPYDG
jgi:hypothetical protein